MTDKDEDWNQHEDLPILVNASYFERMAANNGYDAQAIRSFAMIYSTRTEEHVAHLVRLLSMQGIECQCTESKASPQCLIHVRDNLPDE